MSADQTGDAAPDPMGTANIPAFALPLSVYMSQEAKLAFRRRAERLPPVVPGSTVSDTRRAMDDYFYRPRLEAALARFPVQIVEDTIAGVRVHRVVPKGDFGQAATHRLLINLHGGGFRVGAGLGGLLESVPVAARTGIEVVTVDYRQGPEYEFPAASQDVAAVYHTMLETYYSASIGIFGVSAGGVLTAMTVAWLDSHNIPKPAAIALISAPADDIWGGDSRYLVPPMFGQPSPAPAPNPPPTGMPYVRDVDLYNPLVSPALSPTLLSRFPPTLIVTGTRSGEMSAAVNSHARLVKAGVDARLHVWEGMWHGFTEDLELPETDEALNVMAGFWKDRLGKRT